MRPRLFQIFLANALAFSAAAQTAPPGKALFEKRCGGCHSLTGVKEGPPLGGVYGRAAGSVPSFPYSAALRSANLTWNEESLDRWLADTQKLVPGNDMSFRVENPEERRAIIAYLKALI